MLVIPAQGFVDGTKRHHIKRLTHKASPGICTGGGGGTSIGAEAEASKNAKKAMNESGPGCGGGDGNATGIGGSSTGAVVWVVSVFLGLDIC